MKILIISHTCFSTYNNMGKTFLSLFSSFGKEELCQLYIYPSLPDVDVCSAYYRVTDKDVLKSLLTLGRPGGPLEPEGLAFGKPAPLENPEDAVLYRNKRNSTGAVRLMRDAMWKLGRWYTPALRQWVEQQKPDCIFLAPGYAEFIYDIALKISREHALPIVTYLCDDYYFVREPKDLPGRWQLSRLQKKTDALMERMDSLITICEEMKTAYTRRFPVPAQVIMTGYDRERPERKVVPGEDRVITYFGNLSLNRDDALAEIGQALDRINTTSGTDWRLELYTPPMEEQTRKKFAEILCVHMKGFVTGEAFDRAVSGSDLLLHVEAFDEETADLVKHSVSTKIADSLASGIPLLAYGPPDVASMAHLIRHGCAFTAAEPAELEQVLYAALTDVQARTAVLDNAARTARSCHNRERNSLMLRHIFEELHE